MQGFGRAVCAGLADRIQMAGVSCVPFLAHSPRGRKKLNGRSRPTLAAVGAFGSKRELLRWYFPNGVLQSVWAMGGGEEGNVTCKASWTESFVARAVCTRTHRPRSWPACARSPGGGVEPPHPLASRSRVRGHLEDRATRAARPRLFPRSAVAASLSHRHFVSRCFRRAVAKQLRPRLSRWGLRGNCRSSNRMCFMTCLCRAHSGRPCHSESLRWGGPGLPEGTGCPFVVSVARVSLAASSSTNELRLWPAGLCPRTRASAVCAREEAGHRRGRCLSHGRRSAPGRGGSMVPAFTLLS